MKDGDTYVFIDVGNFSRYYQESVSKWLGQPGKIDFGQINTDFNATRMFFYDCIDESAGEKGMELIDSFRLVSGSHVRLGTLVGKEKKRRQKEVDILLAVDMLNHAVRENMKRAILMTGDRDFKPVVDSLVQMGVWVEVAGDKLHTSNELAQAGDRFHQLTFTKYFSWTSRVITKDHPIDIFTTTVPKVLDPVVETGTLRGALIELRRSRVAPHNHTIISPYADHAYNHLNPERLKLYFDLEFGNVKWKSA